MEFRNVYTVKKEFDKDLFIRGLLVALGTNGDAPVDAVNATIGEVKLSVRDVLSCKITVEGDCTASVGYDRKEEYFEEVRNLGSGPDYKQVKRTRTVTDWRPFQQSYKQTATWAAFNDGMFAPVDVIETAINTCQESNCVRTGTATLNGESLASARSKCVEYVERKAVSFPGDHYKDTRYHSSTTTHYVDCYKLPMFEVDYTYEGKEYHAWGFACGKVKVNCVAMPEVLDVQEEIKTQTKRAKTRSFAGWVDFGVFYALDFMAGESIGYGICFVLALVSYLLALFLNFKYKWEYDKLAKDLSQNRHQAKLEALAKVLEEKGFRPITKDESTMAESKTLPTVAALELNKWLVYGGGVLVFALLFTLL